MKIGLLKFGEGFPKAGVLGKFLPGFFAALLVFGAAACTTIDMFTYEDGNVYAELEANNPQQVTLTVDNRGGGDLLLDRSRAAYTGGGRRSPLTALGGSPEDPPLRLPPGTRQSLSFAPAEAVSQSGGKEKIAGWVPEDASGGRFEFTYRAAGEEHPLVFPDDREQPVLGRVKVSLDIPLPFTSSVMERRQKIYDQAFKQAEGAFGGEGKKLRLVNIRYGSTSNGFKEKAVLSADVIAGG
jgi:hypothetical protein